MEQVSLVKMANSKLKKVSKIIKLYPKKYGDFFHKVFPSNRFVLIILRCAAFVVLILLLWNPVLSFLTKVQIKPSVYVLIDDSESIEVVDGVHQTKELLSKLISNLKGDYDLKLYRFSNRIEEAEEKDLNFQGIETAIGNVLEAVEKKLRPTSLILITDGCNNVGKDPLSVAKYLNFPIYTIGVGNTEEKKDIAITRVTTNEIAYTDDIVPVEVWIRSKAISAQKSKAVIKEGEKIIDEAEVSIEPSMEKVIELNIKPHTPGTHIYKALIESHTEESNLKNNERAFSIQVLKSKINILYIGTPNWDYKFLKKVLDADLNIELDSYLIFSTEKLPTFKKPLRDYDCFVVGNLSSKTIPDFSDDIFDLISNSNRGILFMGTNYKGSPYERMLPLIMGEGAIESSFQVEFTPERRENPIISESEDFSDLPPLSGYWKVLGFKLGANVLAVHPTAKTAQGKLPIIATQKYGSGKVAQITAFSLWRWNFLMEGAEKESTFYDTFFSNLFRWLAIREEMDRIVVNLDKNVYNPFEKIELLVQLYDTKYRPLDGGFVKAHIKEIEKEVILKGTGEGKYTATLTNLSPSKYHFSVTAEIDGKRYGQKTGSFDVVEFSLEGEKTCMEKGVLLKIAELTGGRYYHIGNIDELTDFPASSKEVIKRKEIEFLHNPFLFILLLILLSSEWLVRRRGGLP